MAKLNSYPTLLLVTIILEIGTIQSAQADFVCVDAVETAVFLLLVTIILKIGMIQSAQADFVCVDAVSTALLSLWCKRGG